MDRLSKLLLAAAAVALVPIPALAQMWPASIVAGGPRMSQTPAHTLVRIEHDGRLLRRPSVPPTEAAARLKLSDADEVPKVEIRPRAEWSDDQGLRVGPTRVAFKRRF